MIMNNILSKLLNSKKICITCHTSPDGDSTGSALALGMGLEQLGKNICLLAKDPIPSIYKFLPNSELMNGETYEVPEDADCVVVFDCGNLERVNADLKLSSKNYTLINIDHHLSNDMYGDLNFVDTNAAAVGEIVYQMLKIIDIKITPDIAKCLYTSILTDTGSFRFSNTTSVTHTIAGDLINCGVISDEIYGTIYENKPYERVKLYGKAIDNMKLFKNNKVCLITLTEEIFNSLNLSTKIETSDILTIGTQIDSVEVTILMKETTDGVKISLRSKNSVDVRKIAEQFGGGGHTKASGLFIKNNLINAEKIILEAVEKELV